MTCDTSNGLCVPSKIPLLYYYYMYNKQSYWNHNIYLGCFSDSECKGVNDKCDPYDHVCRPKCTQNVDCNGDKMTCDTSKGLCVHSENKVIKKVY